MFETYNKTISYLKNSHSSPKIQATKQLLTSQDHEKSVFDEKMEEELDRFNRMKLQKQKEAKYIYEEELKRLRTMQDLKEKEERIAKLRTRFSQEKANFP